MRLSSFCLCLSIPNFSHIAHCRSLYQYLLVLPIFLVNSQFGVTSLHGRFLLGTAPFLETSWNPWFCNIMVEFQKCNLNPLILYIIEILCHSFNIICHNIMIHNPCITLCQVSGWISTQVLLGPIARQFMSLKLIWAIWARQRVNLMKPKGALSISVLVKQQWNGYHLIYVMSIHQ